MTDNNINVCINKCDNKDQKYTEKCNIACSKPSITDCKTQCNETQFKNNNSKNYKRQNICKKGCDKLDFSSASNTATNTVTNTDTTCPNPDSTQEYQYEKSIGLPGARPIIYKTPHVKIKSLDEISHLTKINDNLIWTNNFTNETNGSSSTMHCAKLIFNHLHTQPNQLSFKNHNIDDTFIVDNNGKCSFYTQKKSTDKVCHNDNHNNANINVFCFDKSKNPQNGCK